MQSPLITHSNGLICTYGSMGCVYYANVAKPVVREKPEMGRRKFIVRFRYCDLETSLNKWNFVFCPAELEIMSAEFRPRDIYTTVLIT
jgi:hypothetical protein